MAENDKGKTPTIPPTPQRGLTKSAGPTSLAPTLDQHPNVITDRFIASLPPAISSSLKIVKEARIDPKYGTDIVWTHATLTSPCPSEELAQARSKIEILSAPLTDTECLNELTALRYSTRTRDGETLDTAVAFKIYRDRLRAFPADVVLFVLRSTPEVSPFWPTWFDLQQRLAPAARRRKLIRDALHAEPDSSESRGAI